MSSASKNVPRTSSRIVARVPSVRITSGVVVATLAMGLAACGNTRNTGAASPNDTRSALNGLLSASQPASTSPSPAKPTHTVDHSCIRYTVTGSARGANITYETLTGSSQASVAVPLTTTDGKAGIHLCGFGSGSMLYISAQNQSESGSLTCEIHVAGSGVVSHNIAQGAYSIATCQSVLP